MKLNMQVCSDLPHNTVPTGMLRISLRSDDYPIFGEISILGRKFANFFHINRLLRLRLV